MAFDARQEFQSLCKRAYEDVRDGHKALSTKIKGYFNNQVRRRMAASATTTYRTFAGQALSFGISQIPIVGGALSKLADVAMNQAAVKALQSEINFLDANDMNAMQEKGELLVASVAQKYCDALRKYDEAHSAASTAIPTRGHFTNCSEVAAYLKTVYYWRYRMVRLKFYHEQVLAYCNAVATHLQKAETDFRQFECNLQSKGPAMFSNWQWHYVNCNDECYWPEPFGQEISAPTNIAASRQQLANAGTRLYPATAFRGYDANGNPILASPHVPPRPPFQHGPMPPPYPPPKRS